MRALLLFLTAASCYSPDITNGQFECKLSNTCPTGFSCICQKCLKTGTTMSCDDGGAPMDLAGEDLSVPGDLAAADLNKPGDMASLPGCSSGPRAMNDPGLAKLALCPAAWAVQGIHPNPGTRCNRMVDPTGKNGATNCTTEDNCAVGWHVCVDQNDVKMKGLMDCSAITNGFWIAAQKGEPPPSPQPMGPPICDGVMYHSVFGCGSIIQQGGPPNMCTTFAFNAVLVNPPDGTDHCSASTSGNFICGTNTIEGDAVTKPMRNGGGVMCCQD